MSAPTFDKLHDNGFVTTPIPSSDYQYSWITGSLGNNYSMRSGKQYIFGHAPKHGLFKDKSRMKLTTGTVSVPFNPVGNRIFISDGTNGIYFRFVSTKSATDPCATDVNDPLKNCTIKEVLVDAPFGIYNPFTTAENLLNEITASVLDLSVQQVVANINLTANYLDEKFNTLMTTDNSTNIRITQLDGGTFEMIPAITFPTASEIYGE